MGKALGLDWSTRDVHRNGQPSPSGVVNASPNVQVVVDCPVASFNKDGIDVELDDECWDTADNDTPGSALHLGADVNIPVEWLDFRYFFAILLFIDC